MSTDARIAQVNGIEIWRPAGTARQLLAIVASGGRAERLARLDLPALVIHGTRDPLVMPTGGERTASVIPGAELIMLEGMGHDIVPAVVGSIDEAVPAFTSRPPLR